MANFNGYYLLKTCLKAGNYFWSFNFGKKIELRNRFSEI